MSSSDDGTHWTTTRVRYGETDQMGVVYHGQYFVYFELGRTEMIREFGLAYADLEAQGFLLMVVEAAARFRRKAGYDQVLRIGTRVTDVSRVRVRLDYEIRSAEDELIADGHTVLASIGSDGRPRALPGELREPFERARGSC